MMNIKEKEDIRFKIEFLKNENVITHEQAISARNSVQTNRLSATIIIHVFYGLYKLIAKSIKDNLALKNKLMKLEIELIKNECIGDTEEEEKETKKSKKETKKGK